MRSAVAIIALELSTPPWSKGTANARGGGVVVVRIEILQGLLRIRSGARPEIILDVWQCVFATRRVSIVAITWPRAQICAVTMMTRRLPGYCPVTLMGHRKWAN